MEVALDAGAQDVISNDDGSIDVITTPEDFFTVKDALTQAELEPGHAEVTARHKSCLCAPKFRLILAN
jgi:transcriptional/translational regulatory protein YebC/TACO1